MAYRKDYDLVMEPLIKSSSSIKLYLIDDSTAFIAELTELVKASAGNYEVVGSATCATQAKQDLKNMDVDVVLLDMNMPRITGTELFGQLRQIRKDLRAIVLSNYGDPITAAEAVSSGVSGYVLKGQPMAQLLQAIEGALSGLFVSSAETARGMADVIQVGGEPKVITTPRERRLLGHLAAGHSNQEIADDLFISRSTLKRMMASLMDRFEARNRTHLVSEAQRLNQID